MEYEWILYVVMGLKITMPYIILPLLFGFVLGLIITIGRFTRILFLRLIFEFYISLIRGTPLLLQLSIVYFALPQLTGIDLGAFWSGVITFSINSSAYVSEIIRSGIIAIDKGQFEAAHSLHIPKFKMMKDIIIPQAIRNIIPMLINEAINLTKESAIIGMIGEADLMRRSQIIAAERYDYFGPLIVVGMCYYAIVLLLTFVGSKVEKKLHDKY